MQSPILNGWKQPNKDIRGSKNPNWKGGKIQLICAGCGKKYYVFLGVKDRSRYCCKECFYKRHPHKPHKDGRGYVWLFKPGHPNSTSNGYIREHRYLMEQKLGRLLSEDEVVHHINNKQDDNRITNLKLYNTQSEHLKEHHANK